MTQSCDGSVVSGVEVPATFAYQWEPVSGATAAIISRTSTPTHEMQTFSAGLIGPHAANSLSTGARQDAPAPPPRS